ncbi:MAG: hypothetical protein U0894_07925 [Pirellulales bacterium]
MEKLKIARRLLGYLRNLLNRANFHLPFLTGHDATLRDNPKNAAENGNALDDPRVWEVISAYQHEVEKGTSQTEQITWPNIQSLPPQLAIA